TPERPDRRRRLRPRGRPAGADPESDPARPEDRGRLRLRDRPRARSRGARGDRKRARPARARPRGARRDPDCRLGREGRNCLRRHARARRGGRPLFRAARPGDEDRRRPRPLPVTEPVPERPGFEHGYGISGAPPETSWSDAAARLESARNYWVATTRPDGRPHTMPVWGLWLDDAVVFSTNPA